MKIVMLCSKSDSSIIVMNKLNEIYNFEKIIIENKTSRKTFLKRRIKRLGLFKVIGQILFVKLAVPVLKRESKDRRQAIINEYELNLDLDPSLSGKTVFVESVNNENCIKVLKEVNPDIVIVNGTRIISEEVLNSTSAIFINMHAGITPKYRGVHGAYWALYNNDKKNVGVTVHIVDKGIDTGGIIYQKNIEITKDDNFITYPLLQTAVGVEFEKKAIDDVINNRLVTKTNSLPSKLYTHPTLFEYLYHRIKYNIK